MPHPFEREQEVAIQAVCEAVDLCRTVQLQITPHLLEKKDRSPVTVADFGSQALICRTLAEAFSDDPVIAEEDSTPLRQQENSAILDQVTRHIRTIRPEANQREVCLWIDHGGTRVYTDRFWTLDPIDGTKGFLRGEQYAISLALILDGQIKVAVLACPNLPVDPVGGGLYGAIFLAVHGHGTSVLSMDHGGPAMPVHVSPQNNPALARFCESVESDHSSHSNSAIIAAGLNITAPPLRLDSQAKYAIVARGEADIYLRLSTRADYREKIWDHAGGALIVTEAGGQVTDLFGHPLDFTHGRQLEANRGVIVTNGRLHDRVLASIEALNLRPTF